MSLTHESTEQNTTLELVDISVSRIGGSEDSTSESEDEIEVEEEGEDKYSEITLTSDTSSIEGEKGDYWETNEKNMLSMNSELDSSSSVEIVTSGLKLKESKRSPNGNEKNVSREIVCCETQYYVKDGNKDFWVKSLKEKIVTILDYCRSITNC